MELPKELPTARLRRAGGRGVMIWACDLCVGASMLFWMWIMWSFIAPTWPTAGSEIIPSLLKAGMSIVLALCWALVLPVLCSAILPNTAAGMYLQEAQRRTFGFAAMVVAAGYLFYQSYQILWSWWNAQPNVAAANLGDMYTMACLIFFVFVPSWIWTQSSPAMWLAEIQQAHEVKRLKLDHQMDLASIQAAYTRTLLIIQAGLDHATVKEREYAAGTITGLHRGINDRMMRIARTVGNLAGVEEILPEPDQDYVNNLNQLERVIIDNALLPTNYVAPDAPHAAALPARASAHQDAPEPRNAAHAPDHHRQINDDQTHTIPYEGEYWAAREALASQGTWSAQTLANVIGKEKETARRRIAEWEQAGLVTRQGLPNGQHKFHKIGGRS